MTIRSRMAVHLHPHPPNKSIPHRHRRTRHRQDSRGRGQRHQQGHQTHSPFRISITNNCRQRHHGRAWRLSTLRIPELHLSIRLIRVDPRHRVRRLASPRIRHTNTAHRHLRGVLRRLLGMHLRIRSLFRFNHNRPLQPILLITTPVTAHGNRVHQSL